MASLLVKNIPPELLCPLAFNSSDPAHSACILMLLAYKHKYAHYH
jgi:hypothetical protein